MRSRVPFLIIAWLLFVTIARALRLPNDYAEAHWLLDYRFGFMKRGLVGSVCNLVLSGLGLQMTPSIIVALSAVTYAGLVVCILLLVKRLLASTAVRDDVQMMALVFVSSPFVVMSGHVFGYFDALTYVFVISSVALMLSGRPLLSAVVSSIALLAHEGYLLMGFPLVCLASVAFHLKRDLLRPRLSHIVAGCIPLLVFGGIPVLQNLANDQTQLADQLFHYLDAAGFVPIRADNVPVSQTMSFFACMQVEAPNLFDRLFNPVMLANVGPPWLAILYYIHCAFKIRPFSPLSLLILACAGAPLAMHAFACDTARIWTFIIAGAFIAAWILAETRHACPPDALYALIAIPAFMINIVGRIPLMDQQVERIPNVALLLLYAPALVLMLQSVVKNCGPDFFGDLTEKWAPNRSTDEDGSSRDELS